MIGVLAIIAILIGDDDRAMRVSSQMMVNGVFLPPIRPPSVASGTARLRMSLCSDHSEDQIRSAVYQLREVVRNAGG